MTILIQILYFYRCDLCKVYIDYSLDRYILVYLSHKVDSILVETIFHAFYLSLTDTLTTSIKTDLQDFNSYFVCQAEIYDHTWLNNDVFPGVVQLVFKTIRTRNISNVPLSHDLRFRGF